MVISTDLVNEYSPVILVTSITSRKTDRVYSFEALIEPPDGRLTAASKVSLIQIRGIDKRRIIGYYGQVNEATMARIESALRIAMGLIQV